MYRFRHGRRFITILYKKFKSSAHHLTLFFQESPFCKVHEVPIKLGSLFTEDALSELRRPYAFPDSWW